MTELRKRMIECLQLRGLSQRTQEAYVRAVRQLAEHYHKSPDLITEEELRRYFLYLKNVKQYSRAASTMISSLPVNDLFVWTAPTGRDSSSSARHRQRPHDDLRPSRQRKQRPLRSVA